MKFLLRSIPVKTCIFCIYKSITNRIRWYICFIFDAIWGLLSKRHLLWKRSDICLITWMLFCIPVAELGVSFDGRVCYMNRFKCSRTKTEKARKNEWAEPRTTAQQILMIALRLQLLYHALSLWWVLVPFQHGIMDLAFPNLICLIKQVNAHYSYSVYILHHFKNHTALPMFGYENTYSERYKYYYNIFSYFPLLARSKNI